MFIMRCIAMLRKILIILSMTFLLFGTSFAKTINLYEEPKDGSKMVGTIDPSAGIVPIYTPKGSTWVKIGNPKNGLVGWVKSNDLATAGSQSSGFSFSQQVQTTPDGKQAYVFQFGVPTQMTKEQAAALYNQVQKQQAAIQQNAQKLIEEVFTTGFQMPLIMPVVMPSNGIQPQTVQPNPNPPPTKESNTTEKPATPSTPIQQK